MVIFRSNYINWLILRGQMSAAAGIYIIRYAPRFRPLHSDRRKGRCRPVFVILSGGRSPQRRISRLRVTTDVVCATLARAR